MLARRSLLLVVACACSGKTPREGIEVVVELQRPLASTCARVIATGGGASAETKPMPLAGKTELFVGVARGSLPADIRLQAVGYSDAECTKRTAPAEQSASVPATFLAKFPVVRLTLAGPTTNGDGGVDLDGDGFPLPADCNDADAGVNPGAPELCANAADEDCDGLIDCADAPACNGMSCGMQGMCMNGACLAPTEQGLCADGFDNDGDGARDCADSDCPVGATCSDFDRCTLGDVCEGDGGCAPASTTMCAAPNACFLPVGQCLPDAGTCVFTPSGATMCEDGLRCTVSDACLADGGCSGTATVCPIGTTACRAMTGICREALDGGCDYPPLAAGPCDDLDNCTVSDGCDGDGGCIGSPVACTAAPGECFSFSGACGADGGCLWEPRAGACDGGICSADGGCSNVVNPFPFVPSNFSPSQLPAPAGAYTFGCGTTVLDTVSNDGGVQWMNPCAAQPVPPYRIIMVGGQQTVLLSFGAITVNGGSSLRLIGGRPVIIAAQGAVTVNGNIDVSSVLAAQRGAGSNNNCMIGRGADGQTGGSPETGGGGGGGAFGSDGGTGSTSLGGIAGGAGGTPRGMRDLVPLQGGCHGGNGGRATSMWGFGGAGGGAVQLTASGQVLLNGGSYITASGSGGRGGQADQRIGGGGGGSGGGILIEAQRIQLNGGSFLTANGGAGGEGSGYGGVQWSGVDGQEGSYISAIPAQSISIGACGGNGGTGAAGTTPAGNGGAPSTNGCQSNVPGGGGGGGVGRIRLNAATGGCSISGSAVISPPATSNAAAGCP